MDRNKFKGKKKKKKTSHCLSLDEKIPFLGEKEGETKLLAEQKDGFP